MAKPEPKTPPGRNSFGRTYEEQNDWERAQKAKKMKDTNPLAKFIGDVVSAPGKFGYKLGSDLAKKLSPKQAAVKKKKDSFKIPASPTK